MQGTQPQPQNRRVGRLAPRSKPLESMGGIEGIYKLISDGTEAEKEAFIDACQGF